ncbi:MAG: response regulator transcription factor [Bacteroidota bacterium]
MTDIKAVIIDDEKRSTLTLHNLLSQYCSEVEVVGIAHSKDEAIRLILSCRPNLVFLDVELSEGSGFDLLEELPTQQFELIFVTGFNRYALQAIKFHALDYLLKPVDIKDLIQAVERAKARLQRTHDYQRLTHLLSNLRTPRLAARKMAIPNGEGKEFIAVEEIVRLQADRAYTWFYLKGKEKLMSSKNMGEYEKLLPGIDAQGSHHFIRIHHRHLVNLHYIKSVNGKEAYVKMQDGTKLPIAQRRKTDFFVALERAGLG